MCYKFKNFKKYMKFNLLISKDRVYLFDNYLIKKIFYIN